MLGLCVAGFEGRTTTSISMSDQAGLGITRRGGRGRGEGGAVGLDVQQKSTSN